MALSNTARIVDQIARDAGHVALDYYNRRDSLQVDAKRSQDFVTIADQNVELNIRAALTSAFPNDAIVGEEHAAKPGTSGRTWVIDPIDGTANFVQGLPLWCVVVAGVWDGRTQIGVIYDPIHNECFVAGRGQGAYLNGAPISVVADADITSGTVGIGYSAPRALRGARLAQGLADAGAMWSRLASGAISLAYVASGRWLGYAEVHMNAWDFLAGQLLVAEAGGIVEDRDAEAAITNGDRVIAGAPGVFEDILRISEAAFAD